MKRGLLLAILGLAVSVCAGCGGGGSQSSPAAPLPPPAPAPAPVTTSLLSQPTVVPGNAAGGLISTSVDVAVPYAGTVNVSFDWMLASSDVDLVVTGSGCNDGSAAYTGGCTAYGADRSQLKPATASFPMSGAGTIRIWLYNFASAPESGLLTVTIMH
jgi:hypothetical protein